MSNWKMTELKIELKRWGEHKGSHVGLIRFERDMESFVVRVPPDRSAALVSEVADLICQNAHELARRLREELEGQSPG